MSVLKLMQLLYQLHQLLYMYLCTSCTSCGRTSCTSMDEAQLVELPNGDLLANMRHKTASQVGRGVSRSTNSGATWGPVWMDHVLISPVCVGE